MFSQPLEAKLAEPLFQAHSVQSALRKNLNDRPALSAGATRAHEDLSSGLAMGCSLWDSLQGSGLKPSPSNRLLSLFREQALKTTEAPLPCYCRRCSLPCCDFSRLSNCLAFCKSLVFTHDSLLLCLSSPGFSRAPRPHCDFPNVTTHWPQFKSSSLWKPLIFSGKPHQDRIKTGVRRAAISRNKRQSLPCASISAFYIVTFQADCPAIQIVQRKPHRASVPQAYTEYRENSLALYCSSMMPPLSPAHHHWVASPMIQSEKKPCTVEGNFLAEAYCSTDRLRPWRRHYQAMLSGCGEMVTKSPNGLI